MEILFPTFFLFPPNLLKFFSSPKTNDPQKGPSQVLTLLTSGAKERLIASLLLTIMPDEGGEKLAPVPLIHSLLAATSSQEEHTKKVPPDSGSST